MKDTRLLTPLPDNAHIQFTATDPLDVPRLIRLLNSLEELQDLMPGLYVLPNRRLIRVVDVTGTILYNSDKRYDVAALCALFNIMGLPK